MADGAEGHDQAVKAAEFTGGCQCGAVRYVISAAKLTAYCCHCTECQKQSASAFGISVPAFEASVKFDGEMASWRRATDSGSYTDCYFCHKCGSRIYHSGANRPGMITIKGGSLDQSQSLRPVAHIWMRSSVGWLELPSNVPQWETQPQDEAEWMRMLGWAN